MPRVTKQCSLTGCLGLRQSVVRQSQHVYNTCMQKKLTITIDEHVYEGLYAQIGQGKISQFIEALVRPHVLHGDLDAAYKQMADDQAREVEALEWSEGTLLEDEFR